MGMPLDSIVNALKLGASVRGEADSPVRVGVYVDWSATRFLIETVRDAFVPQTTSALVRVERLDEAPATVRSDTDVILVLSCGGERLQSHVQELVVHGIPVVVLAESSVEVPFILEDTRMLGLIAASDKTRLLASLARWILDRTEKRCAFASNFPFMRIAASRRVIASAALGNVATGALFFMPGADFPVMTLAQIGMALQLAAIFGRPLSWERGYEVAAVLGAAFALRGSARLVARRAGRLGFIPKALIAGAGTLAIGYGLAAWHERDVSYERLNRVFRGLAARMTSGEGGRPASSRSNG